MSKRLLWYLLLYSSLYLQLLIHNAKAPYTLKALSSFP